MLEGVLKLKKSLFDEVANRGGGSDSPPPPVGGATENVINMKRLLNVDVSTVCHIGDVNSFGELNYLK